MNDWEIWWEKNDPGIIPGQIDTLERKYIKKYSRLAFDNFSERIKQLEESLDFATKRGDYWQGRYNFNFQLEER